MKPNPEDAAVDLKLNAAELAEVGATGAELRPNTAAGAAVAAGVNGFVSAACPKRPDIKINNHIKLFKQ